MKLHKYIIGLALLVSSSSCNFLDEEAYEFITPDNFYKTEADANAALTAVYNTFADEKSYRRYIWMGADFPGEAANANASAPSRVEMDNLTWTPTTDFCKNIWQISYSAIRRANNLLLNIDNITFKSEEVRKQIVGQTKFLRALAYFDLIRFYDHIVVIRETDNLNDEAPSNQGTDDAAWALIEEDLLYAGSALPIKWEDSNAGRATKGAAMAMLAKVYLTQAGWPWNKSGFWEKAASQTTDIINNEGTFGYGLEENFRRIFDVTNEHGKEYIFDIEFQTNINGNDSPAITGMRGYNIKKTEGWSSFISTPEFYKSYEVEDKRISTTFVTEFTDINNGKQYVYDPDNIAEPSFPLCHFAKYLDPNDNQSTSAGDYSCNRKIIRYADVLLMQSEAYCEMNRIGDALAGINRVRARAGLNPIPSSISQTDLRKAIIQERTWEFAAEGHSLFDMKRQHCMAERLGRAVDDKYYSLPLPQDETDKNPNLKQHPLW